MDNGKEFDNTKMNGLCEKIKIKQVFSSRSYPQG